MAERTEGIQVAAFYLARFTTGPKGSPKPPPLLNVKTLAQAYKFLYQKLRRPDDNERKFRGILDQHYRHFLARLPGKGEKKFTSQRDIRIFKTWGKRPEAELLAEIERHSGVAPETKEVVSPTANEEAGDWAMRLVDARQGQPKFRREVGERFSKRCAITRCTIWPILEAAHIDPHCIARDDDPTNGLLLRADIHTLFDLHLLGIRPETRRVELHHDLEDSRDYKHLKGKAMRVPEGPPIPIKALESRYEKFRAKQMEHLE